MFFFKTWYYHFWDSSLRKFGKSFIHKDVYHSTAYCSDFQNVFCGTLLKGGFGNPSTGLALFLC